MGARGQGADSARAQDLSLSRPFDVRPRQISQPRRGAGGARQVGCHRASQEADAGRRNRRGQVQGDRQGNPGGGERGGRLRRKRTRTRPSRTLYRRAGGAIRSEEHTSELQSLMRISYAVFCLKKKKKI